MLISDEQREISRQFGKDYFDGDRMYGYGGYHYHSRFWQGVVRRMRDYYDLADDASGPNQDPLLVLQARRATCRIQRACVLPAPDQGVETTDDAQDAVQDAFLSAFRNLDSFAGHSSLATWLHGILVNVCLLKLRSQSRKRSIPIDDLLPTFDESGHHARPVREWTDQAHSMLSREETR